jgi:hypothetical protein
MPSLKQPAITKHPNGTASFYLRVKTAAGSMWEACTEKPKPIAEIIASLENEYLGYMRRLSEPLAQEQPCECTDPTPDTGGYRCRACGGRWPACSRTGEEG